MIESSNDMELNKYRTNLSLQAGALETGVAHGWWTLGRGDVGNLSPAIRSEAQQVQRGGYMKLLKPANISLEVTGIAGDQKDSKRTVDFEWNYKDLMPLSKRVAVKGGTGKALFQLYDDGWRLVSIITITTAEAPYPLSPQERKVMLAEIAVERERKATAQRAANEARRAFENRIRLAQVSTRNISEHSLETKSATQGKTSVKVVVRYAVLRIEETIPRLKKTETIEVRFAQLKRNETVVASYNVGYLWIANRLVSVDREAEGSPAYTQAFNAANKAFDDWKTKYADVIAGCAHTSTLGCVW